MSEYEFLMTRERELRRFFGYTELTRQRRLGRETPEITLEFVAWWLENSFVRRHHHIYRSKYFYEFSPDPLEAQEYNECTLTS